MSEVAKKINKFLHNPATRFACMERLGLFDRMPDEQYLKLKYKSIFGKELNLDNPQTFNEKLQWLKLHNRKPEYTIVVDKYLSKQYVADKIGAEYVVPLLGVWDDPDEIDFDALPDQFVLKCSHNSGVGMCICKDKSKLDIKKVREELRNGLKEDYYLKSREWPYKNVPRKIIAEQYLLENRIEGREECLTDYKFFCFDGKPKVAYISKDNALHPTTDFFDMEFDRLDLKMKDPPSECPPQKPAEFDEMKKIAEVLSCDVPHLRVDFYDISGKLYVGELTFYHNGGFGRVSPEKWDKTLGDWIKIPGGGMICDKKCTVSLHYNKIIDSLNDYKFYCFDGKMKFMMINTDRNSDKPTKADYFDRDFNWLDFTWGYQHADVRPSKPDKFDEMITIAEKLSEGLPHVRVDLYECNGQIYFGELTFFDGGGFDKIEPLEWDYKIGEYIVLPEKLI